LNFKTPIRGSAGMASVVAPDMRDLVTGTGPFGPTEIRSMLDALGTERIPDPTTAGDFCRRYSEQDVQTLMNIINEIRLRVWGKQPEAFFDQAIIDADGTIAETTGQCKQGMDISYKGLWGYHPLLISLANTAEPLYLVNRSGNCTSSSGAAVYLDQAKDLCLKAGFRKILMRGDTDFSQTSELDRWDDDEKVVHPNNE